MEPGLQITINLPLFIVLKVKSDVRKRIILRHENDRLLECCAGFSGTKDYQRFRGSSCFHRQGDK